MSYNTQHTGKSLLREPRFALDEAADNKNVPVLVVLLIHFLHRCERMTATRNWMRTERTVKDMSAIRGCRPLLPVTKTKSPPARRRAAPQVWRMACRFLQYSAETEYRRQESSTATVKAHAHAHHHTMQEYERTCRRSALTGWDNTSATKSMLRQSRVLFFTGEQSIRFGSREPLSCSRLRAADSCTDFTGIAAAVGGVGCGEEGTIGVS
jgi:hypothetical protein